VGRVTFYDGVSVLGTATLANGQASFTTSLLPSGTRLLRAYYGGSGSFSPSTSVIVTQTVMAVPANGFLPVTAFGPGTPIGPVVMGDFNSDGRPDFAVVTVNGVSVLLGNGDGTFRAAPVSPDNSTAPQSIAAGDFNGDGKSDLAIVDSVAVRIRLGNGDGTFQAPLVFLAGSMPTAVAVGDWNGDGIADLAVSNQSGVSLLFGAGDGTFRTINLPVAGITNTVSVVVGDFNRDGKADLALGANAPTNEGVGQTRILLGNGDGTFSQAFSTSLMRAPLQMAVADFNGDGKPDLVALTSGLGSISVSLGNGDGTLQPPSYYVVGPLPQGLAVGDLNGDGKVDVAVGDPNTVNVLLGNGDGTLQAEVNYPTITLGNPYVFVGDFNGDGKADLVTGVTSSGFSLLVGEVRPITATSLTSSLNPSQAGQAVTLTAMVSPSFLTGYVTFYDGTTVLGSNLQTNGQATLTLASLAPGTHSLTAFYPGDSQYVASTSPILIQTVSGALTKPVVTLSSSSNPSRFGQAVTLTATVFPSAATGSVTFYDGQSVLGTSPLAGGRATLTTSFPASGGHALTALYGGDVSFAPAASVVLAQTVNVSRAFGFTPTLNSTGIASPYSIVTADFNADGFADFAVTNSNANSQVAVLLGKGDGTFQAPLKFPAGSFALNIAVGDFNGDGKPDLIVSNGVVLLGNGDGTFRPGTTLSGAGGISTVADFNGDGKADVAGSFSGQVFVQLGNGDGTFQAPLNSGANSNAIAGFAAMDCNGDGKADLAVANANGVGVLLGNGDGTFRQEVNYPTDTGANAVAAADFNADGKVDLAVANGSGTSVSILLGNGDGTFRPAVNYPGGNFPMAIAAADFNGDGKMDLAVAGFFGNTVLLLGNGDGTFQPFTSYSSGSNPIALAVGDFNGDGRADLAAADWGSTNVDIFLGSAPATQLTFTTQPANSRPSVSLPPVVVQVQDANGNAVAGFTTPVVTLASIPGGVAAMATALNGTATFTGLTFGVPGVYRLQATSPGLAAGLSNLFGVANSAVTVAIESPLATVPPPGDVQISGWALDNVAVAATAIKVVSVTVDGVSIGFPTYGISRPDVCAVFSGRPGCPNVGYSIATHLSPGQHTITVTASDSDGDTGSGTMSVTVQSALAGTKVGVFRNGAAFLEDSNGNGAYDAGVDRFIPMFTGPGGFLPGDLPVTGDWTGDGHAKVGIYRSSTGTWYLDANNNGAYDPGDYTYQFGGVAGDIPITGDWNGLGRSCVGIFRSGFFWILDLNCNGFFDNTPADAAFPFGGVVGDIPVVGAWTGGTTRVGVVRKYAPGGVPQGNPFYWILDASPANAGNLPANHPPGIAFAFGGLAGDVFVTGDWYNNGTSAAGVYRNGLWVLDAALPAAPQASHVPGLTFGYGGVPGDLPVTGKW
jgi:hypothetical protein